MYTKFRSIGLRFNRSFQLLFMLLYIGLSGFSQSTVVKGTVTDSETGEPIPYVSIRFINTQTGTLSDSLGHYQLTSKNKVDSIHFSTVGYLSKTFVVLPLKTMNLPVALISDMVKLSEVKIIPDDGPVRRLLKEMVKRKKQNDPAKHARYSYLKYTKWEYHLNNVGSKMIQWAFLNDQSVFKTNSDKTRYLPIYFSEQLVFNEFQRNPLKQKSTVLADKTSGVSVLDDY